MFVDVVACPLTHWGRVTHTCVNKQTIIALDNGLSPGRRQAIIWTNAGMLLIVTLGTNFSEILIEILTFSFKKMRSKVSSAKRRPFCLGLNVLTSQSRIGSSISHNICTRFCFALFCRGYTIGRYIILWHWGNHTVIVHCDWINPEIQRSAIDVQISWTVWYVQWKT